MPRFRFVAALLIVGTCAMVATLAGQRQTTMADALQREQIHTAQVVRQRWFDEQRVSRERLDDLGFSIVADAPGLLLLAHDSGHCFLAPSATTPYIETDPALCVDVRGRAAAARAMATTDPSNLFRMIPR